MKSERLAVNFNSKTKKIITDLARKEHVSVSKIIRDMIEEGLEKREDKWLSSIVEERDFETENRRVSHEDAWK